MVVLTKEFWDQIDRIVESRIRIEKKIDQMLAILEASTFNRHDIQIHELATATGTAISE